MYFVIILQFYKILRARRSLATTIAITITFTITITLLSQ